MSSSISKAIPLRELFEESLIRMRSRDAYKKSATCKDPEVVRQRKARILDVAAILGPNAPLRLVVKKSKLGWGAFFKYEKNDPSFRMKLRKLINVTNNHKRRKTVDWRQFDYLCRLHCSSSEIAGFFGCSVDSLLSIVKREKKMTLGDYIRMKASTGKVSLRRYQWNMARSSAKMQIFLGKNYLNQSDNTIAPVSDLQSDQFDEQMAEATKKLNWGGDDSNTTP